MTCTMLPLATMLCHSVRSGITVPSRLVYDLSVVASENVANFRPFPSLICGSLPTLPNKITLFTAIVL